MNRWPGLITATLFSFPCISYSAEALILGEGQTLSAPDYVQLEILVDSKCYPSANDARKINDEATRKIVDFLNKRIKKQDDYNRVSSSGGVTSPYYTYHQDKYLCQNTFQKQNTIIFRTQNLQNFETLFDEIQNMIYKQFPNNSPAVIESSISYVTMANPIPGISSIERSRLERKSMGLAFEDALAKLNATFGKQKIQNLKIVDVSEISPEGPKPLYQTGVAAMAMNARMEKSVAAPVQFEEQIISKTLYFKFRFDDPTIE